MSLEPRYASVRAFLEGIDRDLHCFLRQVNLGQGGSVDKKADLSLSIMDLFHAF